MGLTYQRFQLNSKAVKAAVYDMAEVAISEVNVHVESIVTEKSQKPDLAELFNEDFLND